MRKQSNRLGLLAIIFGLVVVLGATIPSVAQEEENLLENPGFEEPFETFDGSPERIVASGWEPWHVPHVDGTSPSLNAQPEYDETAPDVTRIRTGDNAQKMFTSFFTFHGGIYQEIDDITAGSELRFSLYSHIWSSSSGDPEISEGDGGVLVQVGIDPDGGTDGEASEIVWSSSFAVGQYDTYRQYSVITNATASTVTVFVRVTMEFPCCRYCCLFG